MKRLNFEQNLAEEPSMRKIDPFFVLILVLISGFSVLYKSAEFQFSDVKANSELNQKLVRQIEELKLRNQVALIERGGGSSKGAIVRAPSSISPQKDKFVQPILLAEAYYNAAKANCDKYKKEQACVQAIDTVITQFPESHWAGESLLLLSHLYIKTQNTAKAKEMLNIVRQEFKNDKEIQKKLKEFEKAKL